jgi:hypothetical protein
MTWHRHLDILALLAILTVCSPAKAGPIECRTGKTEFLAGTQALPDNRYATATGMVVAPPARPEGWVLQRCNSGTIFFAHTDAPQKSYVSAMVSDVGIAAWSGEPAFEAKVLDVVTSSDLPIQHMKIDDTTAVTVDGRPCFDIHRSGTVDAIMTSTGLLAGPLPSREYIRACHLRDKRGPEAAVLVIYKAVGVHDMPDFGAAAKSYVDGVTLPTWMR